MEKTGRKFEKLVEIMSTLRSADGCPWDVEQTHQTLRKYLLEETYEVLEAIDEKDPKSLREELGDLLLQIVFHSQIADEVKQFNIKDVIEGICQKLIRRHPNVFGDADIKTAKEQSQNWEKIKQQEQSDSGRNSALDNVPKALSALIRATRIQQKAATVGFDWEKTEQVWEKVREEISELEEALRIEKPENIEEEFGDLLFALVNISRFIKVNPEDALRSSTNKFIRRFQQIESVLAKDNKAVSEMSLKELDALWDEVKQTEDK